MERGDRIDGWIVEERLGAGGMGSVYRCRNAATDRLLAAVKVLEKPLRKSEEAQARFAREAHILARLDHPGIVRVRNVRIDADPPYIEMEFIQGESLEQWISAGRAVPYEQALGWMLQIADAVRYLHDQGVRHRDLKPANLILDPTGRIRLVDFGLATETELARITAEGLNFGTVSYAPPEWIDPARLDPVQWDLYALGVLFHELLTGRMAFPLSGEGPARKQLLQVMMAKQSAPPLDPGPPIPERARALIRDLTALRPEERPRSAVEVLARLRALPPKLDADAATVPLAPPRRPAAARSFAVPLLLVGSGLALVSAIVAAATILWPPAPPPRAAPVAAPTAPVPAPDPALPPPSGRTVEVLIEGPPDVPLRVRAGAVEVDLVGGRATLRDVGTEVDALVWIAGEGCGSCPGEGCGAWCATGTVPLVAGPEPATVVTTVPPPGRGQVTVTLPLLASQVEGGPFKKKKPIWHVEGRIGDRRAALVNHWTLRFDDVPAGRHRLVAQIGGCPPAAEGCWPDGSCPEDCRSAVAEVVVPWAGGAVTEKIRMPPPP